ncbi:hypothetical protein BN946_scf184836.g2 [Trametes cinnabarina]|uniref:Uncharacterized protein n=1 Tax=Pycnoporus cinnabarinus TaxID=5643 RepID=A0A060SC12_PYCCI|nr:hypothetical protein BN946_scf184836.g2 [Trametes cinnabarina]
MNPQDGVPASNVPTGGGGNPIASTRMVVPAPRSAPTGNPQQNLERLKAAVTGIETLKEELREVRRSAREREAILYSKTEVLHAELEDAKRRIKKLEALNGYPESDEEGERPSDHPDVAPENADEDAGEPADGHVRDVNIPTAEEVAKSRYWWDKKEIKKLMDVSGLDAKNLPPFPENDIEWPTYPQMPGEKVLRFNWSEGEDSTINRRALDNVLRWIKTNGSRELPAAALALKQILDGALMQRIVRKVAYMRGEYRKHAKARAAASERGRSVAPAVAAGDDGGVVDGDIFGERAAPAGDVNGDDRGEPGLKATYRSRAEAKCEQRKRKAAQTELANEKYAAAFTVNAMSDDEDDPAPMPGEATKYISRRPWYRSDEARSTHIYAASNDIDLDLCQLQHFFEQVDALADPDPDLAKKMTARWPGEEKQKVEPPRARMLKNRLRVWMIKADALAGNPHWLTSGRVAASGKAWGDAEDPVEEERKGRGKGNKVVKFRRIEETADVKVARERYQKLTEGRDVDGMFESA